MIELGRKSQIQGAEHWPTFPMFFSRPTKMPKIPKGHTIVCGLEQEGAEGERMFICETPEDVHTFYDEHARGHALRISWYHTDSIQNSPAA